MLTALFYSDIRGRWSIMVCVWFENKRIKNYDMVKDKLILRKIAKRWCKGILMANDLTGKETAELLTEEEMSYIQEESFKIADRITKMPMAHSLDAVIREYFDCD